MVQYTATFTETELRIFMECIGAVKSEFPLSQNTSETYTELITKLEAILVNRSI